MPESKGGLSPSEHRDLNEPPLSYPGGGTARNVKIAELRKKYSSDPIALQEIDVYEGNNEFHRKIEEFVEAHKNNDQQKIDELNAWLHANYPDIS